MTDYILNDGTSDCCGASILENTERCSECNEICNIRETYHDGEHEQWKQDEYLHLTSAQKKIQKRYE